MSRASLSLKPVANVQKKYFFKHFLESTAPWVVWEFEGLFESATPCRCEEAVGKFES